MNNFAIIQRSSWTKRKIGLAAKINKCDNNNNCSTKQLDGSV
jgi:hypothetical protein